MFNIKQWLMVLRHKPTSRASTHAISLTQPLSVFLLSTIFMGVTLVAGGAPKTPSEIGQYNIGFQKEILFDANHQLPNGNDRPLEIMTWYPTTDRSGAPTTYSLLGAKAEGVPNFPNNVFTNASVASGKHPLVVYSHGNTSFSWESYTLAETLASHGYIVTAVNHTLNTEMDIGVDFANMFGGSFSCPLEAYGQSPPPCVSPSSDACLFRPTDVSFMIDTFLARNGNANSPFHGSVREDRIAVAGWSFGGDIAFAMAAGNPGLGIPPDNRVKAIIPIEPDLEITRVRCGLTATDRMRVNIPVLNIAGSSKADNGSAVVGIMHQNELPNASPNYFIDLRNADLKPGTTPHNAHTNFCDWNIAGAIAGGLAQGIAPKDVLLGTFYPAGFVTDDPDAVIAAVIYKSELILGADILGTRRFCPELDTLVASGLYLELNPADTIPAQRVKQLSGKEATRLISHYSVSFLNVHLNHQSGYKKYLTPEYADENGLSAIVNCKDLGPSAPTAKKCAK